ncbi:hypothetical protein OXPF_43000 [Oxobacter pfennigii]|uniref:HTH tetR-type domain-containing protein n=1 Tax=Oxobacter pfennigii TaxID=36849 RepID=A0A0P8YS87_9CLOT|nr:TetR/AcrR family transcriptional regulator [Oxobacter pfennigii]KPU42515.1 hypothetical protein OXPF_43000 [Oxobacter pfennigii]
MYKKGQDKKEEIYKTAKKLLYEIGYTNTTIKRIAELSDAPISLVHYYFCKKDKIISCIYKDFLDNIVDFLRETKPEIFTNSLLSHSVTSRIYYDIILNNSNNKRVYHEVLLNKSNYHILNEYIINIYKKYIEDNSIIISDELFNTYSFVDFGARREFFLNYFSGNIKLSVQEAVTVVNSIIPRLYKLNQHFIDSIMMDSISIFNSLDYSKIKFLI